MNSGHSNSFLGDYSQTAPHPASSLQPQQQHPLSYGYTSLHSAANSVQLQAPNLSNLNQQNGQSTPHHMQSAANASMHHLPAHLQQQHLQHLHNQSAAAAHHLHMSAAAAHHQHPLYATTDLSSINSPNSYSSVSTSPQHQQLGNNPHVQQQYYSTFSSTDHFGQLSSNLGTNLSGLSSLTSNLNGAGGNGLTGATGFGRHPHSLNATSYSTSTGAGNLTNSLATNGPASNSSGGNSNTGGNTTPTTPLHSSLLNNHSTTPPAYSTTGSSTPQLSNSHTSQNSNSNNNTTTNNTSNLFAGQSPPIGSHLLNSSNASSSNSSLSGTNNGLNNGQSTNNSTNNSIAITSMSSLHQPTTAQHLSQLNSLSQLSLNHHPNASHSLSLANSHSSGAHSLADQNPHLTLSGLHPQHPQLHPHSSLHHSNNSMGMPPHPYSMNPLGLSNGTSSHLSDLAATPMSSTSNMADSQASDDDSQSIHSMDDDCKNMLSQNNSSLSVENSDSNQVIYPWMKKASLNGKIMCFLNFFRLVSI